MPMYTVLFLTSLTFNTHANKHKLNTILLQAIIKLQERTSNCSITDILLDQSKFHKYSHNQQELVWSGAIVRLNCHSDLFEDSLE